MEESSLPSPAAVAESGHRDLQQVPFVELVDGRVQGCVSSGSDLERLYVCTLAASGSYSCRTNANRPCGGLRGGPCKHIGWMLDAAAVAYGLPAVAACLGRSSAPAPRQAGDLMRLATTLESVAIGAVFGRFQEQLELLGHPVVREPVDGLAFFPI